MREDGRPCPKLKFVLWQLFCAGWMYAFVGSLVLLLFYIHIGLNIDNIESIHAVVIYTLIITNGLTWLLADIMPPDLSGLIAMQIVTFFQIILVWSVGEFALSRKTTAGYYYVFSMLFIVLDSHKFLALNLCNNWHLSNFMPLRGFPKSNILFGGGHNSLKNGHLQPRELMTVEYSIILLRNSVLSLSILAQGAVISRSAGKISSVKIIPVF